MPAQLWQLPLPAQARHFRPSLRPLPTCDEREPGLGILHRLQVGGERRAPGGRLRAPAHPFLRLHERAHGVDLLAGHAHLEGEVARSRSVPQPVSRGACQGRVADADVLERVDGHLGGAGRGSRNRGVAAPETSEDAHGSATDSAAAPYLLCNGPTPAGLSGFVPFAETALERAEELAERVLPARTPKRRMLVIVNPYASTVSDRLKSLVVYALQGRYAVEAVETQAQAHATAICREAA